jgi:hypothetical protein
MTQSGGLLRLLAVHAVFAATPNPLGRPVLAEPRGRPSLRKPQHPSLPYGDVTRLRRNGQPSSDGPHAPVTDCRASPASSLTSWSRATRYPPSRRPHLASAQSGRRDFILEETFVRHRRGVVC